MSADIPLYAECDHCGERWKAMTLPLPMSVAGRILKKLCCPNCGNRKTVNVCVTAGEHAVTEARQGVIGARCLDG